MFHAPYIRGVKGTGNYYWGLIGVGEELVSRHRLLKYTRLYNMYFDRPKDTTERKYFFENRCVGVYLDKQVTREEDQLLFELRNEYDEWIGDR